jgi:multisubunit Na+/H+ antiporter MnhE subunit
MKITFLIYLFTVFTASKLFTVTILIILIAQNKEIKAVIVAIMVNIKNDLNKEPKQ